MEEYKMLIERENSLKIDKDLIEIQRTIVYYGKKIEDLLNKLNRILEKGDIPSLKILEDKKETDAFINHLRKIK